MGGIQPVDKNALLNDSGSKKVYVSPTRGRVLDRPSDDSIAVDRSTWWGESPKKEPVSPLFSVPEVAKKINDEVKEMAIYFPDFVLRRNKDVFWQGKIDGLGEVKIIYPLNYPSQKFLVEVLDLDESFNESLKDLVCWYDNLTPAGAVIISMRLFLRDRVAKR